MLAVKTYERARAVAYARRWARGRNPLFFNFTGIGGDCTNFVSQCVLAGSCVMNMTPTFGWYYRSVDDRAPAFTGVEAFWDFMTGAFSRQNGGIGPFGREVEASAVEVGDVVQLGDEAGDYYHTLLITETGEGGLRVTAHSNDALDRPLSSYDYSIARFLHMEGVRFESDLPDCYEALLAGEEIS